MLIKYNSHGFFKPLHNFSASLINPVEKYRQRLLILLFFVGISSEAEHKEAEANGSLESRSAFCRGPDDQLLGADDWFGSFFASRFGKYRLLYQRYSKNYAGWDANKIFHS